MKFSIIIPTLNETNVIQACLLALQFIRTDCEIIVVDGGSLDNTAVLAKHLADKVIICSKGRSLQMNRGADHATGNVLIFLHADTYLPKNALTLIEQHISQHKQWGRFDIALNGNSFMLKIIAFMMNWRSRLTGIATGDQVIFVTQQLFNKVGQYPEINLMEDIALCNMLNKISRPICLKAKVTSSTRRWEHNGLYKTILLMWYIRLAYFCGTDPQKLAIMYSENIFTQFKWKTFWKWRHSPKSN